MSDPCVLYDRQCIDCGECDICDINKAKRCDNCGKCIDEPEEFRSLDIKKFMKEHDEEEHYEEEHDED